MRRGVAWIGLAASIACSGGETADAPPPLPVAPAASVAPAPATAPAPGAAPARASRSLLTGRDFPDHVVALTWDDGPDEGTLDLARYLQHERVSGTFFVVHDWVENVSQEPGRGRSVFDTGFRHLPVLGQLTALGHRVGNHTENHVLLTDVPPDVAARQILEAQALLAPFERDELRLFRPPGGAWGPRTAEALEAAHVLDELVGPVGWDIDRKDWESSLYCRSDRPAAECEPGPIPGERRVRAEVVARRYLDSIVARGRGIVLLHDRVGHVRSRYALEIARHLVPALKAQGFVFAAPVLAFGPLRARPAVTLAGALETSLQRVRAAPAAIGEPIGAGDLNGDGRPDVCGRSGAGVSCALATADGWSRATAWATAVPPRATLRLVDVNADGRVDLCATEAGIVSCALAP